MVKREMSKRLSFARRACVALVVAAAAACGAGQMTTIWGSRVTSENCWRSYPRPQMVRAGWTNLNGDWDYAVTSVTNTPGRSEKWDGKIRVPFPIESVLSGVGRLLEPDEFLWYTRKIVCDPKPGERTLLHFGGVDFRTMVFIGHDEVTDVPHEGGQNPFTVDITDYLKKGENELTVCVWDPTESFVNSRGKQSFAPTGCFYTRVSGIWQTVWMETVPERHIAGYVVTTDIDRGEVSITLQAEGGKRPAAEQGMLEIEVSAASEPLREKFSPGETVKVRLPQPVALWSPETPYLYKFTAKLGKDVVRGYFGMRKIEKRKDASGVLRFFLNNRPYFMLGTLDQGWWPDGLLTPPSEAAMEYDVKVLKACGFNMLRKHIKVEPQQYYAMCDRLGMLVIQDLPSGSGSASDPMKAETVGRYWLQRREMKEMMDALQTFPSIVMWNPYNEGWTQSGEFLTHSMLDFTRRHDPTRLVNGPSGCWDWEGGHLLPKGWKWENRVLTQHRPEGVCEAADSVDMHRYRGPVMFDVNDRRVSFLGEFGGLGHPVAGHLWKETNGGKGSWGYGGVEDTKTREGLEKTYLGLMDKLGGLAERGLGGSVYTQTTDVEIEINGLLTYDRKVLKYNPEVLRNAHAEVLRRAAKGAVGKVDDPLRLAEIFSDHMVLQAGKPIRVFGYGEGRVSVSMEGRSASANSNLGRWCVELPAMEPGGPYEMTVDLGGRRRVIADVMVGEVLVMAGQSNMQFVLAESTTKERFADPRIRMFSTTRIERGAPYSARDGWITLEKGNSGRWSAIGCEAAVRVAREKGVAVGVVSCFQGASVVETWMPRELALQKRFWLPPEKCAHHDERFDLYSIWNVSGRLYERQFSELSGYPVGSVSWYQGESNTGSVEEGALYAEKLAAMIAQWRKDLLDENLPFYVLQLAADTTGGRNHAAWNALKAAQAKVAETVPGVVLVRTDDICEPDKGIHPPTKSRIAERLVGFMREDWRKSLLKGRK